MQAEENRILISGEYLWRVSAWLLFLNFEKLAGTVLELSAAHLDYYGVAVFLATIVVVAVRRLDQSPLIRDLVAICLLDVLVQVYGLFLHASGCADVSYLVLVNAILVLKFMRLIWWAKSPDGEFLVTWGVFGRWRFGTPIQPTNPIAPLQRLAIYCGFVVAIGIAYVAWRINKLFPIEFFHGMSAIAVLLLAKPMADDIKKRDAERINAITARVELETRIKVTAELHAEAVASNEDLRGAAHDLNNPLVAMTYSAHEITRFTDLASAHAAAQNLEAGLRDLSDLVVDVLEMARLGTKLKFPTDEIISMNKLSDQLEKQLGSLARKRGRSWPLTKHPFA
jgi:signal transduction histidine kinase